jgi:hypothetical protein
MRISEVLKEDSDQDNTVLVTALEFLRSRLTDTGAKTEYSTQALINMVSNAGVPFTYDTLVDANKEDPAVQALLQSISKEKVVFKGSDTDNADTSPDVDLATNTVSRMAQKALKKRT